MKSTLMEEYVKPLLTPSDTNDTKTERKENPNQVRVVDLEKKAWRSFNADTVKGITLTEIVNEGVASIDSTQETDKPLMDNTSDEILKKLVEMLYERNNIDLKRGTFRVKGDVIELIPSYERTNGIRIEFFGDEVERISEFDS